jgi:hypothetical protein
MSMTISQQGPPGQPKYKVTCNDEHPLYLQSQRDKRIEKKEAHEQLQRERTNGLGAGDVKTKLTPPHPSH